MPLLSADWQGLHWLLSDAADALKLTTQQRKLFTFVEQRTVRFKKIEEHIPFAHFRNGIPAVAIVGYPWKKSSFYHARNALMERGILAWKYHQHGCIYRLNIPGLLHIPPYVSDAIDVLSRIDNFTKEFEDNGLTFDRRIDMSTIEKQIAEGIKKSKAHNRKTLAKVEAGGTITPKWIRLYMKEYCAELGILYADVWIKKDFGQASHWLQECKECERDPKEDLSKAMENWALAVKYIKKKSRDFKQLNDIVSFGEFYKHRRDFYDLFSFCDDEAEMKRRFPETDIIKKMSEHTRRVKL